MERPHRPLPSGRIRPAAALTAACGLTGAGLLLAARAGRPPSRWPPAGGDGLGVRPGAEAHARGPGRHGRRPRTGPDGRGGRRFRPGGGALRGAPRLSHPRRHRRLPARDHRGSVAALLAALAATGALTRLVTHRVRLPAGRRAAAAPACRVPPRRRRLDHTLPAPSPPRWPPPTRPRPRGRTSTPRSTPHPRSPSARSAAASAPPSPSRRRSPPVRGDRHVPADRGAGPGGRLFARGAP